MLRFVIQIQVLPRSLVRQEKQDKLPFHIATSLNLEDCLEIDRFYTVLKTSTGTCLRRLQDSVKMSKRDESRNDEAIFLCFVSGCVVSAC